MTYGNMHRFLLRTIVSQSVMTVEDTKKLLVKQAGNDNTDIREIIEEINKNIKPFKQSIKIVNDELSSKELVVFMSQGYDDTSKAQNVFSPVGLEFFRILMEQILNTDMREITEITAINLANNIKVNNKLLSNMEAQRLLNVWCRMRYLDHVNNNYILGVRTIHEFESYFIKAFADSSNMKCYICTSFVFRGHNCPYCPSTIHKRCLEVSLKKAKKWPCCKSDYTHSDIQNPCGRSSRLNGSSRLETQDLESTQALEVPQQLNDDDDDIVMLSDEDIESDDCNISSRPTKRRRLNGNVND